MGWAKLDDGFHDHPKVMGLSLDAVGLYTLALTWAHRHKGSSSGTLGHIPADLPTRFAGSKGHKLAATLEAARLWDIAPALGGWVIHDFTDYLPAADKPQTAGEVRKARSDAGKRGADARWAGKTMADDTQTDGNLLSEVDGKPMPPTRPDPTQPENPPPEAASASRGETLNQRANRLAKTYTDRVPLSRFPAIAAVTKRAIAADHDDASIEAALVRLAGDNRSVTVDSMRVELEGLPPSRYGANGRAEPPAAGFWGDTARSAR